MWTCTAYDEYYVDLKFKKSSEVEEDEDDVDHLENCNLDELNLLEV